METKNVKIRAPIHRAAKIESVALGVGIQEWIEELIQQRLTMPKKKGRTKQK